MISLLDVISDSHADAFNKYFCELEEEIITCY